MNSLGLSPMGKPIEGQKRELNPAQIKSLVSAWTELEDRKRILRNHGLPKPIESGVGKKFPRRKEVLVSE